MPFGLSKENVRDSVSLIKNIELGNAKEDVLGFTGGEFMSNEEGITDENEILEEVKKLKVEIEKKIKKMGKRTNN